jgi:hypothetical protein
MTRLTLAYSRSSTSFVKASWVKPWSRYADDYANARVCVVVGVGRVETDFYAFFQRESETNGNVVGLDPPECIKIDGEVDNVPVLVEVVEGADDVQVATLPSLVWFGSFQEGHPRGTDTAYLSLFEGRIKVAAGPSNGEVGFLPQVGGEAVPHRGGVRNVVKRGAQVVNGVAYNAYEVAGAMSLTSFAFSSALLSESKTRRYVFSRRNAPKRASKSLTC